MNIFLWALQGFLAFLYLAGGAFKTFNPNDVAKQIPAVPKGGWRALGVVEMLGGILLVVPAVTGWAPSLTPLVATVLAIETLALAALYARYSLKLTPSNPLVYAAVMGIVVAFVAYGRYALVPLA